ncbi:MAG: hypothetical protein C0621_01520 [Desulfuromonas sp.]|nr:MAG: hypothetical protein C0621_01520 [Desulfuromonas sp.]
MDLLKSATLLIVEDDVCLRQATVALMRRHLKTVYGAENGRDALALFHQHRPDLVLTDLRMPEMDGLTLTEKLREISPETPVLLFTAFSDSPTLIRGIELGVAGFIPKPATSEQLLTPLLKAARPILQKQQVQGLQQELQLSVERLLGRGETLSAIAAQTARIARTDYPLLLQGETGSGKSRLAGLVHRLSPRHEHPFVTVQLGALPESLVASELFGHQKGAFTDATQSRRGRIAEADGGTLFLDDIDAAPLTVQGMLLQLVEEQTYTPVGSNCPEHVNLRIIAASNRDLAAMALAGTFRQDLYYRLAGLLIDLPPLRNIPEEIPPLANLLLEECCLELGRPPLRLEKETLKILCHHPWPGNVRQLRNTLRQAALLAGHKIDGDQIEQFLCGSSSSCPTPVPKEETFSMTMEEVERWAFRRALEAAGQKKMVAARLLDLNYYTFKRRLARLGLDVETR